MANKYMKSFSTPLAILEIKIEIIMRYYCLSVSVAKIKTNKNWQYQVPSKDIDQMEILLVEMQNDTAPLEKLDSFL